MADDIDDLLDEVESKYVKDRSKEPRSSNTKPQRKRTEDEEEVDQMIEDICGDTEPLEKCNIPKSVPSNSYQNRPSSSKCFPVFMGGSNCPQGYANSFNKRACDKLRCTSCDFQVVTFEDFEWHSSVDYLFLRNNVPDFHRLKSKLCRKKEKYMYKSLGIRKPLFMLATRQHDNFISRSSREEYHQSVKQFGSRSGPTFCPDLGPNCLQRLSADDKLWLARKELRGL